jgi:hypothetical protein
MTIEISINPGTVPPNDGPCDDATLGGRVYRVFKNIYDFVTSKAFIITVVALTCLVALGYAYMHYQAKQFNSMPMKAFNLQDFVEDNAAEMAGFIAMLAVLDRMPFKTVDETDLLILPTSYKQAIPLNGIKAAELEKLKMILPEKLFTIEGTESFKKEIKGCLKLLTTRPAGRELLFALQARAPLRLIIREDSERSHFISSAKERSIGIKLNSDSKKHTKNALGQKKLINDPDQTTSTAITLAHELIHFLHYLKGGNFVSKEAPNIDEDYDDIEEQQTICGWGKQLLPLASVTPDEVQKLASASQEELDELFNETIKVDYDCINENRLRAEFNLEHRINHYGSPTPKSLKLNPRQEVPKEIRDYVFNLIGEFPIDFEHFLKENSEVDLLKVKSGDRPFLSRLFEFIFFNSEATTQSIETFFPILLKHTPNISLSYKLYFGELIRSCKVLPIESKFSLASQLLCK